MSNQRVCDICGEAIDTYAPFTVVDITSTSFMAPKAFKPDELAYDICDNCIKPCKNNMEEVLLFRVLELIIKKSGE